MADLRPGDPSPNPIVGRYRSMEDLFSQWRIGFRDISPTRGNWEYRVEDDILIRSVLVKGGTREDRLVGLPVPGYRDEMGHRCFYYRMSNWRMRLSERFELSGYGGIPVMDVELAEQLFRLDCTSPVVEAAKSSYHHLDRPALDFIRKWTTNGGLSWSGDGVARARSRIQVSREGLFVAYRSRARLLTVGVGRFDHENKAVIIRGQSGRSPEVLWAKDALYSSLARVLGGGMFSNYKIIGQGYLSGIAESRILVKQAPEGLEVGS